MKNLYVVLLLATQIMHASELVDYKVSSPVVARVYHDEIVAMNQALLSPLPLKALQSKKQALQINKQACNRCFEQKQAEIDSENNKIQEKHNLFVKCNQEYVLQSQLKFDPLYKTPAHIAREKYQALSVQQQIEYAQLSKIEGVSTPQDVIAYWDNKIQNNQSVFYENKNAKLSAINTQRTPLIFELQQARDSVKNIEKELHDVQQAKNLYDDLDQKYSQILDKKAAEIIGSFVNKKVMQRKQAVIQQKQHVIDVIENISSTHVIKQHEREKDEKDKIACVRTKAARMHRDILEIGKKKKQADLQRQRDEQAAEKLKLEQARKEAQRKAAQDKKDQEHAAKIAQQLEQQEKEQQRSARQKAESAVAKEKRTAEKQAAKKKADDDRAELVKAANIQAQSEKLKSVAANAKTIVTPAELAALMAERREKIKQCSLQNRLNVTNVIQEYDRSNNLFQDERNKPEQVVQLLRDLIECSSETDLSIVADVHEKVVTIDTDLSRSSKKKIAQLYKYFVPEEQLQALLASRIASIKDQCKDYNSKDLKQQYEFLSKEKIELEKEDAQLALLAKIPMYCSKDSKKNGLEVERVAHKAQEIQQKFDDYNARIVIHNKQLVEVVGKLQDCKVHDCLVDIQNIIKNKPDVNAVGFLKLADLDAFAAQAQAIIDDNSNKNIEHSDFHELTCKMVHKIIVTGIDRQQKMGVIYPENLIYQVAGNLSKAAVSLENFDNVHKQRRFERYLNEFGQDLPFYSVPMFADLAKMQACLSDLTSKKSNAPHAVANQKLPQPTLSSKTFFPIDPAEGQYTDMFAINNIAKQIVTAAITQQKNHITVASQVSPVLKKSHTAILQQSSRSELSHFDGALSHVVHNVPDALAETELFLTNLFESSSNKDLVSLENACQRVRNFNELLLRSGNTELLPTYFKNNTQLHQMIAHRVAEMNHECANYKSRDEYMKEFLQLKEDSVKLQHSADKVMPVLKLLNAESGNNNKTKEQNHVINNTFRQLNLQLVDISHKIEQLGIQDQLQTLQRMIVMNPHEKA